jgi:hypothetical protein
MINLRKAYLLIMCGILSIPCFCQIVNNAPSLSRFSLLSLYDTFRIQVEMTDCGEWGGHREYIYIHKRGDHKLYATFQKDKVPCGKIVNKNGLGVLDDQLRVIIRDTTVIFKKQDENSAELFIKDLLKQYLNSKVGLGNYGDHYIIYNTDSSFLLDYFNSGNSNKTLFKDLKYQLFGKNNDK